MQTLPFLYSAIIEDETSITGRRRVILRDDLPVDLPEVHRFDSEIRIRYQLAVVTNRQVRELRYDVLGDRIAVRRPFLTEISFNFDREFGF